MSSVPDGGAWNAEGSCHGRIRVIKHVSRRRATVLFSSKKTERKDVAEAFLSSLKMNWMLHDGHSTQTFLIGSVVGGLHSSAACVGGAVGAGAPTFGGTSVGLRTTA